MSKIKFQYSQVFHKIIRKLQRNLKDYWEILYYNNIHSIFQKDINILL